MTRITDVVTLANAYVSGMKEDLNFHGNQFNLLATFFTCGYLVGQIPSQLLLTRCKSTAWGLAYRDLTHAFLVRASWYLPTAELCWSIITFGFAGVQNVKTVFALRFIIGMLESPFAVGVLTVMGGYYTKRGTNFHIYELSLTTRNNKCIFRARKANRHLLLSKLRRQHVQWLPPSCTVSRPRWSRGT